MLQLLELLAVTSNACFGVLLARAKRLDAVGVFCIAFLVAFGGGTLRDLLLDRQPLFWVANEHYVWITLGIALVGAFLPRVPPRLQIWLEVPDALGLAFFSMVGAALAIGHEPFPVSPLLASLFGVMTGTFGGVLADIACATLPRIFRPSTRLYASCSFAGCWVYLLLREGPAGENAALLAGAATVVGLRLAALRWNLRLPASPA
jgi:uncharacterized membrane protein YeiH